MRFDKTTGLSVENGGLGNSRRVFLFDETARRKNAKANAVEDAGQA